MADSSHVTVLAIGTGSDAGTPMTQMVTTEDSRKNVLIQFVTPLMALTVGFIWTFLNVLIAVITAAGVAPELIPFTDFRQLVAKAATFALTAACVNMLKDLLTLFTTLKNKFPLLNI